MKVSNYVELRIKKGIILFYMSFVDNIKLLVENPIELVKKTSLSIWQTFLFSIFVVLLINIC
ncbi:hypothetical protein CA834_09835 [Winogradskyella aurantia]|uniref:Uncharacterized protein n=1 Tax=Winogradskyella aurantia TaxID=1915063 RepID=A0A265US99_9FLAO|nr:hypothetical protein CA834_09835 [Winogradskyella aurantia]